MLSLLFEEHTLLLFIIGSVLAFVSTILLLTKARRFLPQDRGRAFAAQGAKSKGKPTSSGILFISCYLFYAILFLPLSPVLICAYITIGLEMIFGFLDDKSNNAWSELKKGILDALCAIFMGISAAVWMPREIIMPFSIPSFTMPIWLYAIFAAVLIWGAINFTNCTDGVDGLSSSMAIASTLGFIGITCILNADKQFVPMMGLLIPILCVYLFFNRNPSVILMGDSGSRAIGVFLAICAMASQNPFTYLIVCLFFIADGGSGLLKLSVRRFFHMRNFMENITTPIHDHFRKRKNWTNKQVTIRFALANAGLIALLCIVLFIGRY